MLDALGLSDAPVRDGASRAGALTGPVGDALAAESGTRLKAERYVAADGARRWTFQWSDAARNEDCSFQLSADGKIRCLPAGASTYFFADTACATRVANVTASCAVPAYASVPTAAASTCPTTPAATGTSIRSVGPRYTGAVYYRSLCVVSGGRCHNVRLLFRRDESAFLKLRRSDDQDGPLRLH
jgi:hypothetical protein